MVAMGQILRQAVMITGFVFVMMLLVEYINVRTRGTWTHGLQGFRWRQHVVATGLGATPGCLGAFASVTLYAHGLISLGSLVGCMIATSGDEAFVLLAMCPLHGLVLMVLLFGIGLLIGVITDRLEPRWLRRRGRPCLELITHESSECGPQSWRGIGRAWRHCSLQRGVLALGLIVFVAGVVTGEVGPPSWNWIRITLLGTALAAAYILIRVSDHFLEAHLWAHVARRHVPRVFIWTLGALLAVHWATANLNIERWIEENPATMLLLASAVGFIPESGPHLLFVTLFADGKIPFSVLLASSIVQDGHGMLPLLSYSWFDFLVIKVINFCVGVVVGMVVLAAGW